MSVTSFGATPASGGDWGEPAYLEELADKWLQICGPCDGGLPMECTHPQEDPRSFIFMLVTDLRRFVKKVADLQAEIIELEELVSSMSRRTDDHLKEIRRMKDEMMGLARDWASAALRPLPDGTTFEDVYILHSQRVREIIAELR